MLTAPELDGLLEILNIKTFNPQNYDAISKEKLDILYNLLSKIEPLSDDELKILYISVDKGSIEDYGDFDELREEGLYSNYEEFKRNYQENYPEQIYWYKMTSVKYKHFRSISINSKNVVYADMDTDSTLFENLQLHKLLDFLIFKVKEILEMLKENTYNDYVSKNLSYKNRFGVIKRSNYWKIYPETKRQFLKEISKYEIDYFIKNASEQVDKRIKDMTSGKYFECVRLAYEANKYDIDNLTDKELYLKYADGRDEGLSSLNLDNSKQFDTWYNDKNHIGGHPWEIIRGHSFSRVNLFISHDEKGYYLSLDGSKILRKVEIAKIFVALSKNDIPVQIYDVETLKSAFCGDDYVGIVPDYIMPIECSSYFKTYKPTEFVHLENEKMFEYIKWEELEKIRLKRD